MKKCTDMEKGLDVILRFLPEGIKFDELDIILSGSSEYVAALKKKLEDSSLATIKIEKKRQVKRTFR